MTVDPLSDVVSLSGPRCTATRFMEVDGEWNYSFAAPRGIKFIAVTHGACWLAVDPHQPCRLHAGDVFMLRGDERFQLATDLDLPPANGNGVFTAASPDDSTGPHAFQAICGHVAIDRESGRLLIDALPPLIVIDHSLGQAPATAWMLERLVVELNAALPGHALACEMLTQLIFVQLIRARVSDQASSIGWIAALGDEHLARALRLMHGSPTKAWKVAELAMHTGLSRTSFATRFSRALGVGPVTYLANWRMHLAERQLRMTSHPVAVVARSVGFASISAFGAAFRQRFGVTPRDYREHVQEPAPSSGVAVPARAKATRDGPVVKRR